MSEDLKAKCQEFEEHYLQRLLDLRFEIAASPNQFNAPTHEEIAAGTMSDEEHSGILRSGKWSKALIRLTDVVREMARTGELPDSLHGEPVNATAVFREGLDALSQYTKLHIVGNDWAGMVEDRKKTPLSDVVVEIYAIAKMAGIAIQPSSVIGSGGASPGGLHAG